MKTTRKPDAAERIAALFYPEGTMDHEIQRHKLSAKIRRALRAEAKRAAAVVWRPMSEKPEPGHRVVLQLKGWNPMIAWHDGFNWFWHSGIIDRRDGHWTELPPPPKARKGASQ